MLNKQDESFFHLAVTSLQSLGEYLHLPFQHYLTLTDEWQLILVLKTGIHSTLNELFP